MVPSRVRYPQSSLLQFGMKRIFLDTETTGLSAQKDRIVEIAAIEVDDDLRPVKVFHAYLNPCQPVGYSERIHGLSDDFLKDKELFSDIANELVCFLNTAEVYAHNFPFDAGFLNAEFQRCGHPCLENIIGNGVDTLAIARGLFPGERHSLDRLLERFDIDGSGRSDHHGALIDAQLLIEVFRAFVAEGELRRITRQRLEEPRSVVVNLQDL